MARSILLAFVLALGSCTASQGDEVGTGPLTLSPKVAATYEQFRKQSDRYFFAVSKDGETVGYSFCPEFGGCRRFGARKVAVESCEKVSGGVPCYIYADRNGVLWKGEVAVLKDNCSPAFNTEDWDTASRECRRLAEQGYAQAQFNLGVLYYKGQGVRQDYVQSHKWLRVTAARLPAGESRDRVVKLCDLVAGHMTTIQKIEAEKQTQEWLEKHKKAE